eukprot:m.361296 g.361296  ORF g.361296 m.361296 type:complete len:339 (+) comp19478_c0_seq1:160-1176(+)
MSLTPFADPMTALTGDSLDNLGPDMMMLYDDLPHTFGQQSFDEDFVYNSTSVVEQPPERVVSLGLADYSFLAPGPTNNPVVYDPMYDQAFMLQTATSQQPMEFSTDLSSNVVGVHFRLLSDLDDIEVTEQFTTNIDVDLDSVSDTESMLRSPQRSAPASPQSVHDATVRVPTPSTPVSKVRTPGAGKASTKTTRTAKKATSTLKVTSTSAAQTTAMKKKKGNRSADTITAPSKNCAREFPIEMLQAQEKAVAEAYASKLAQDKREAFWAERKREWCRIHRHNTALRKREMQARQATQRSAHEAALKQQQAALQALRDQIAAARTHLGSIRSRSSVMAY